MGNETPVTPSTINSVVKITKAENGFIVVIGCKTFVTANWAQAAEGLEEFFTNPIEAEKKYCKK